MLRISKKADYAVFLLGVIARQGAFPGGSAEDSVVSAHEIARHAGLNKSVVANLLKDYAREGLLESVRGLRGGYRLARHPSEVTLREILEVVEGRFVLVDCVDMANEKADTTTRAKKSLLGLAPSATAGPSGAASGGHDCSLISFCPSKHPMRVVHARIQRLFDDIHLDELCSLAPAPTLR